MIRGSGFWSLNRASGSAINPRWLEALPRMP
jgi:hypothetical protein